MEENLQNLAKDIHQQFLKADKSEHRVKNHESSPEK